jgi:hypothetical protein
MVIPQATIFASVTVISYSATLFSFSFLYLIIFILTPSHNGAVLKIMQSGQMAIY